MVSNFSVTLDYAFLTGQDNRESASYAPSTSPSYVCNDETLSRNKYEQLRYTNPGFPWPLFPLGVARKQTTTCT